MPAQDEQQGMVDIKDLLRLLVMGRFKAMVQQQHKQSMPMRDPGPVYWIGYEGLDWGVLVL